MEQNYDVVSIGALNQWRGHFGGFTEAKSRDGRRIVDHELAMQFIGLSANALQPGEQAGYWHAHSRVEELYVFLEGTGQMGLDDEVVEVAPGTVVRVGQDVWRTWRARPDSPGELRWLCIRAGGGAAAGGSRRQHPRRAEGDALGLTRCGGSSCRSSKNEHAQNRARTEKG